MKDLAKYFGVLCLALSACGPAETPKIGALSPRITSVNRQDQSWQRMATSNLAVTLHCSGFIGVLRGETHRIDDYVSWSGVGPRDVVLSEADLPDSGKVTVRLRPGRDTGLVELVAEGLDRTKSFIAFGSTDSPTTLRHEDTKGVRRTLLLTCKNDDAEVVALDGPIELVCSGHTGTGPGESFQMPVQWNGKAAKKVVLSKELSLTLATAQSATAKAPELPAMLVLAATRVDGHLITMASSAAGSDGVRLEQRDSATKREIIADCHRR